MATVATSSSGLSFKLPGLKETSILEVVQGLREKKSRPDTSNRYSVLSVLHDATHG